MMTAIVAWLASPIGRYVAVGAAVIAASGAAWGALVAHDRAIRAELLATQEAEFAVQERQLHQATVAAFGRILAGERANASHNTQILKEIAHVPATSGCASSPAVSAALRGLRNGIAEQSATGHPGSDAVLPGGAETADRAN